MLKVESNICRVCLRNSKISVMDSRELDDFQYVLVEVSADDRLPKSVCLRCRFFLKIAAEFKRTAIASSRKLQGILDNAYDKFTVNDFAESPTSVEEDLDQLTVLLSPQDKSAFDKIKRTKMTYKKSKVLHRMSSKLQVELLEPTSTEYNNENEVIICDSFPCKDSDTKLKPLICSDSSSKIEKTKIKNTIKISKNTNRQIRHFKREWIRKFAPWLIEKDNRAYCKFCSMHLSNIVGHIERHKNTIKHAQSSTIVVMGGQLQDVQMRQFKCRFCSREYINEEKLLGHLKIHENGESMYKCALCPKKFRIIENAKDHLKSHVTHKASFKCLNCHDKFPRKATLLQHMMDCDKKILTNFEKCPRCSEVFTEFDNYYLHMIQIHDDTNENCWVCGENFQNDKLLRNHLMEHDIIKI